MRGCVQIEKRCEVGDMIGNRNLDVLALSETKLKGKGEVWLGEVKGSVSTDE